MTNKFQKGNTVGNRFSATNQPKKKNGRKPSVYKTIATIVGEKFKLEMTKSDFYHIQQWLLEQPLEKLKYMYKDPETPTFMKVHISALTTDIKNGNTKSVQEIYDRLYGRATQPVEMDASLEVEKEYDLSSVTDTELKYMAELMEKTRNKPNANSDTESQNQQSKATPAG